MPEPKDKGPEWEATHCSRCGGEKDAEGWCANYCTDDDPPLEKLKPAS